MTAGPLAGLKVIELAGLAPVPFGCMLLADLGADVLRVDRPLGSAGLSGPGGPLDRGRRSIRVDLKSSDGIAAIRSLSARADVFVEGFRPGVAERLGLGPTELMAGNERLIYGRLTGWGQDGPLANTAGHDINYVALAGALEPLGRADEAPHPALNLLGDFAGGGMFLALGVLAAVIERATSGKGQIVDAAMVDGASTLVTFVHAMRAAGQWSNPRGHNVLDGGAEFYETYETADGRYVAVGAVEPAFYEELLVKLGIPSSGPRNPLDSAQWHLHADELKAAFLTKTRDEWASIFANSDACVTPVLSPEEAATHPHAVARSSFIEIDGVIQPAPAPRFSRSVPPVPVALDADGRNARATLTSWGLNPDEADHLVGEQVVS